MMPLFWLPVHDGKAVHNNNKQAKANMERGLSYE
jgi:hypothetical protein